MNDAYPPNLPPAASPHPGPPLGWRPMSGLAVTSFVLSLLFILVALFGVWISELLPLGLGVMTLATVKAGARRGRVLAIWAIVIALGVGSCSYVMHSGLRGVLGEMAESLMSALSTQSSDEDKSGALKPWIYPASLEKDPELIAKIFERYGRVEEAFGAYQGDVKLGNPLLGAFIPLLMPPEDVVEVGSGEDPPGWTPGGVIWIQARFERGTVQMAIVLKAADQEGFRGVAEIQPGGQAPIVGDIRFFQPRADAPTDGP